MGSSAFGFKKAEDSPGFLLWQTTVTWQRLIKKQLDNFEVSHAQFVVLAILLWMQENKQESTQAALVRLSKLDKMTVSKALKDLAKDGRILRAESKEDTRIKTLALTNTGRKLARQLVPIVESVDTDFFGKLTLKEQKSMVTFLSKIS